MHNKALISLGLCAHSDSLPKLTKKIDKHETCDSKKCDFICIEENIYVCKETGNIHLCTANQCDFRKAQEVCSATWYHNRANRDDDFNNVKVLTLFNRKMEVKCV